ncbi:MAG: hypothetical protein HKN80_12965 [Acidimicrobiia bacterium]|nr:hypothetical protein [Acidimicrobiia bacterium]
MIAIGLVVAACGGDDSSDGGATDTTAASGTNSDQPDPCTLAGDDVLALYFGDAVPEFDRTEAGPIAGCRWRNENADSLLIQVATDFELFRPDPCRGCVDLTFGDDGYATESIIQSSATFVDGSAWYGVTTTGFGDDLDSITALAETIYQNATN